MLVKIHLTNFLLFVGKNNVLDWKEINKSRGNRSVEFVFMLVLFTVKCLFYLCLKAINKTGIRTCFNALTKSKIKIYLY